MSSADSLECGLQRGSIQAPQQDRRRYLCVQAGRARTRTSSSPRLSGANKAVRWVLCCVELQRIADAGLGCCIKRDCSKAWTQLEVRFSAYPRWLGTTGLADEKLPAKPCKGRWDNRGAEGVAGPTPPVAGGREGGPSC